MLYLMLQKGNNEYLAKVGFTRDVNKRRYSYRSHNPRAIMRSCCAGQQTHESSCHYKFTFSGAQCVDGTELFDKLYEKGMGYFRENHKPIHFMEKF